MPTIELTATSLKALGPIDGKRTEYFDEALPGFSVRVSPAGRKSFSVLYRRGRRLRRYTLGSSPPLTLSEARRAARIALAKARKGGDPATRKLEERRAPTFAQLAEEYLERYARRTKKLDRDKDELRFELAVESYQVPFEGELEVSLVENDRQSSSTHLKAERLGHYTGNLAMTGNGPFRLQLVSTDDAERVAQVAIPGSRAVERDVTTIGELGQERLFSMMPEPGALPLRGGFVTDGDFIATPLVVEDVVSERFTLHAKKDLNSLKLVVLDLQTGDMRVVDHGNAKAGDEIVVESESPLCTVFAGCAIDGQPFEGYSSFIRPSRLALEVDVPETTLPGQDLVVRLSLEGTTAETPVLLAVRDERLTATDRPSVSLGASVKKNIAAATEGMDEGFFEREEILAEYEFRERRVVYSRAPASPAFADVLSHDLDAARRRIGAPPQPTRLGPGEGNARARTIRISRSALLRRRARREIPRTCDSSRRYAWKFRGRSLCARWR